MVGSIEGIDDEEMEEIAGDSGAGGGDQGAGEGQKGGGAGGKGGDVRKLNRADYRLVRSFQTVGSIIASERCAVSGRVARDHHDVPRMCSFFFSGGGREERGGSTRAELVRVARVSGEDGRGLCG